MPRSALRGAPKGSETLNVAEAKRRFSELIGWLDAENPFFEAVNEIVDSRQKYVPRIAARAKHRSPRRRTK